MSHVPKNGPITVIEPAVVTPVYVSGLSACALIEDNLHLDFYTAQPSALHFGAIDYLLSVRLILPAGKIAGGLEEIARTMKTGKFGRGILFTKEGRG